MNIHRNSHSAPPLPKHVSANTQESQSQQTESDLPSLLESLESDFKTYLDQFKTSSQRVQQWQEEQANLKETIDSNDKQLTKLSKSIVTNTVLLRCIGVAYLIPLIVFLALFMRQGNFLNLDIGCGISIGLLIVMTVALAARKYFSGTQQALINTQQTEAQHDLAASKDPQNISRIKKELLETLISTEQEISKHYERLKNVLTDGQDAQREIQDVNMSIEEWQYLKEGLPNEDASKILKDISLQVTNFQENLSKLSTSSVTQCLSKSLKQKNQKALATLKSITTTMQDLKAQCQRAIDAEATKQKSQQDSTLFSDNTNNMSQVSIFQEASTDVEFPLDGEIKPIAPLITVQASNPVNTPAYQMPVNTPVYQILDSFETEIHEIHAPSLENQGLQLKELDSAIDIINKSIQYLENQEEKFQCGELDVNEYLQQSENTQHIINSDLGKTIKDLDVKAESFCKQHIQSKSDPDNTILQKALLFREAFQRLNAIIDQQVEKTVLLMDLPTIELNFYFMIQDYAKEPDEVKYKNITFHYNKLINLKAKCDHMIFQDPIKKNELIECCGIVNNLYFDLKIMQAKIEAELKAKIKAELKAKIQAEEQPLAEVRKQPLHVTTNMTAIGDCILNTVVTNLSIQYPKLDRDEILRDVTAMIAVDHTLDNRYILRKRFTQQGATEREAQELNQIKERRMQQKVVPNQPMTSFEAKQAAMQLQYEHESKGWTEGMKLADWEKAYQKGFARMHYEKQNGESSENALQHALQDVHRTVQTNKANAKQAKAAKGGPKGGDD